MIVLGIHFGHDASVSVVRDGRVVNCIERERLTRAKHAIGITKEEINIALQDAGITADDVDYCAVTSTQRIEYLFIDPDDLSFEFAFDAPHAAYCRAPGIDAAAKSTAKGYVKETVRTGRDHPYVKRLSSDFRANLLDMPDIPAIDDFFLPDLWLNKTGLEDLAAMPVDDVLNDEHRLGMQLPIKLRLESRVIPGFLVAHHFAHAAYAFYSTNFYSAAILSHDGSMPETAYWGGMFYYGEENKLYAVAPHYLSAGNLYERVAFLLNLGFDTGAGKLMGLAPWGKPTFFDPAFVGNWHDGFSAPLSEDPLPDGVRIPDWIHDDRHPLLYRWLRHCFIQAGRLGYDFGPLGNTDLALAPINTDLAASTQKLLEEVLLRAVEIQYDLQAAMSRPTENLCLTGGVALNCPANSAIFNRSRFREVSALPAVSDGGLSIGGALAVCHNVFNEPRPRRSMDARECAYLGRAYSDSVIADALEKFAASVIVETPPNAAAVAATDLARNEVVAWFDGRSETGPRALGHRSILAHPGIKENWERVNRIKGRELWRPFAPVVQEDQAQDYFEGAPIPSPFMLFTAMVRDPEKLPAITHVDGSSRIQTVTASDGEYFRVLEEFYSRTGVPVLMNTSLNGPGEPIVETADDAIRLFISSDLDVLYLNGRRLTKRISCSPK
ncbi:MAG: carbamoyltransferase [Rhodospirillales bacterium CG15_BIG_FIL_POST_REV_8_21_14_020_66_15]|nr:MAG: carbamoyltransferase [Rhodospirillales bacterium CG15_BIG_FIL_POST_REV_8_21_14_020_66_15]